jgi:hypothetical protein
MESPCPIQKIILATDQEVELLYNSFIGRISQRINLNVNPLYEPRLYFL